MPRIQTTAYCNRLPPAASRWLPKLQSLDGQRWQRRVAIGGGSRCAACYATDKVRAPAGADATPRRMYKLSPRQRAL